MNIYGLKNDTLAAWIVSEHLDRFTNATMAEIISFYIGIYSTRPTSWLAVLARNRSIDQAAVIPMDIDSDLVRIPGMRRSKFILTRSLAPIVFGATRLPLIEHEWRLHDVGLQLKDFWRILPDVLKMAKNTPIKLEAIKNELGLTSPQVRACITVATYHGTLIRMASSNPWSNRWLYAAAPDNLIPPNSTMIDRGLFQKDIVSRYIEHYGPVSLDDIAWWMAISKKTVRSIIEVLGAYEIFPGMWVSKSRRHLFEKYITQSKRRSATNVWFLPAWDPLLMGYAPGSRHRSCLGLDRISGYDASGNGRPIVLIGSRAVTTWKIFKSGSKRYLKLDLGKVSSKEQMLIQKAAVKWANQIGVSY
jgi:hypothetical protein